MSMVKTSFLLLFISLGFTSAALRAAEHNKPSPFRIRSVVMAPHGMVAASHPLAAQVSLDILQRGGNAIDAAIAVNACLGVMEPMMCGVGGDLYALVWNAKTKKLYGLNASGRSLYQATRALFARKGLREIP